jgi:outer membrane protein assembly factor BamB
MRTLSLACLLTLALAAAGAPPDEEKLPEDLRTRTTGSDWTAFLGPTANSVSPETGSISPWPKNGLRVVWEKKVNEGYAMPAISRGRLFVFDRVHDRNRLQCWKSETGEALWSFDYPTDYEDSFGYSGGPRCFPVVDGDRVYTYGAEGMLHCLRISDGKVIWKCDTKADFGVIPNFFGVGSTPVIEGDLLLVQVGGSPKGSEKVEFDRLKSNGSALVALDKVTGKVKYKTGDELASYSVPVLATIGDKRWCFLFARGGLLGLDPKTGEVRFHYPYRAKVLASVNASNPVVVGDKVFISETYGPGSTLLKVKGNEVAEVWSDANKERDDVSMQCHWMTPIHVDGYLYGCSGRHDNNAELRCIELATGKVMWTKAGMTRSSLLQADGHFLCLDELGTLRLLKINPKKYEEVSAMELRKPDDIKRANSSPFWAAPILSHGLLYVRGNNRLVCLELIPEKKK